MTTVRDATFDVLRANLVTEIFANPGSTEVPFLTDLPGDLRLVLALHEGAVVGMATGHAIATGRPAFVTLHTTAGLGNAVGALATARVNRAPLVVVVGQQDRRHLAFEPFLTGRLDTLAGSYPVWVDQPATPADVPVAVARAHHEAVHARGPAIVVVPMDDWDAELDDTRDVATPVAVRRAADVEHRVVTEIAAHVDRAEAPVIVVGAGADDADTWRALGQLVDRLGCPVWQEAFGARAGFPQDHPQFAGHLPAGRSQLRKALGEHDLVLVVGASAFRQYAYEPGPLVSDGVAVVVVTDDPDEAHHSSADLAVIAPPAAVCARLTEMVPPRSFPATVTRHEVPVVPPPAAGEPLRATHVFAALAERLPRDTVLVEETPSTRPLLHRIVPARTPRGFVSAAMGGLGFALPAAAGLRMGDQERPVVAVVGDGSSMYGIQALWSAVQYRCGVLYIVLSNGGYAIMDRLAENRGGTAPWPQLTGLDVRGLAAAQGCQARRIESYEGLAAVLDDVLPDLATRTEPLLLDVTVAPEPAFAP